MAPFSSRSDHTALQLNREKIKPRKPAVEKMRRDRISCSIEQLRALLLEEFRGGESDGRLEKADVLELTVRLLKQRLWLGPAVGRRAQGEGHSQCWRDVLHFLSASPEREAALWQLRRFHEAQRDNQEFHPDAPVTPKQSLSPAKQDTPTQMIVWRPW
ncbi:transcription factor HES-5-like [Conger conger]|uniref:transcription factor HES-5-like n=1 Tax=Conger conger TaxID=82655 RepID=UPI002A5AB549|nr:transcription factor HES-5-like [Conger conger]